ncbi:MAG: hypothetical protein GF353_02490, partial [Candidatus Lokiarchaeota archaeon]|nr:hypothetical protein [Candidatus Lokiarchaeota archaeon]
MNSRDKFEVNEYISLKLEGDATVIYVKGEKFDQCRSLFFHKPTEIKEMDFITSIDEAEFIMNTKTQRFEENQEFNIDPTTEFWGHCSN